LAQAALNNSSAKKKAPLRKLPKSLLLLFLGGTVLFAQTFLANRFGQAPEGRDLERIMASPHYKNGEFRNLEPTTRFPVKESRWLSAIKFLFSDEANRKPTHPLPVKNTDLKKLNAADDLVVWLGHSTFYMHLEGRRLLIDPVLSRYAAPLPFMNKAFAGDYPYTPEALPDIDIVILSHDHWDHADFPTLKALHQRVGTFICPLGVGSHLRAWGIPREKIRELDWNETLAVGPELTLHALPARHFAGRGLFTKNKTLWAAFAFETSRRKIFYSGDGGYGAHFADIGKKFGGFDLAILENGQYDKRWANVHMTPEEAARAAEDLKAKAVLPAHAARFSISLHSWDDPYKRLATASAGKPFKLLTPTMGEPASIDNSEQTFSAWWTTTPLTTAHQQR
jgi:L-ascorbate metabolism protein UlaG (beta-lactamase superfamily)